MASPRSGVQGMGSPMAGIDLHAIIGELSTDDQFWLDISHAGGAGTPPEAPHAGPQLKLEQPLALAQPQPPHDAPSAAPMQLTAPQAAQQRIAADSCIVGAGARGAGAELDGAELRTLFSLDLGDKVPFMWERCTAKLRVSFAGEEQVLPDSHELSPLSLRVVSDKSLLYSEKKRQWTWHKKWTLPRFSVELLSAGALLTGSTGLTVHVTAVVFNEGEDRLEEVGLSGKTSAPYVGGMCSFQSLFFKSTSFNNKGASFHLLIGVVHRADAPDAPRRLLGCWSSSPIHVDARKRQLTESTTAGGAGASAAGRPSSALKGEEEGGARGGGLDAQLFGGAFGHFGADGLGGGCGGPRPLAQAPLEQAPAGDGAHALCGGHAAAAAAMIAAPVAGACCAARQLALSHAQLGAGAPMHTGGADGWAHVPRPPAADLVRSSAAAVAPLQHRGLIGGGEHAGGAAEQDCERCTERHGRGEERWQQLVDLAHESVLQLLWLPAPQANGADGLGGAAARAPRLEVVDVLTSAAHGYSREELRGSDFMQMVHPSERVLLKGVLAEFAAEHSALRLQARVLSRAGDAQTVDGNLRRDHAASALAGRQLLILSTRRTPSWNTSSGFHVDFET